MRERVAPCTKPEVGELTLKVACAEARKPVTSEKTFVARVTMALPVAPEGRSEKSEAVTPLEFAELLPSVMVGWMPASLKVSASTDCQSAPARKVCEPFGKAMLSRTWLTVVSRPCDMKLL